MKAWMAMVMVGMLAVAASTWEVQEEVLHDPQNAQMANVVQDLRVMGAKLDVITLRYDRMIAELER